MVKICIDAGHHTNHTNAGICAGYYESVFNWKLHLMLIEELNKYKDVECVTFRKTINDTVPYDVAIAEICTENRARGAKAKGCDLLVSLHSNGCDTESVDRVVVYHSVRKPMPELAELFGKTLYELFRKEISSTQKYQILQNPLSDKCPDCDYFGVQFGASTVDVPCIIVEHSFHSNRRFCEWAVKDENIRKVAEADAKAITEYYKLQLKQEEKKYTIQKGDVYTNGVAVPSRLIGQEFTIAEEKTDRILLKEINSWVKRVATVQNAAEPKKPQVGDKYTIKAGDYYTNGVKVPSSLKGKQYTISKINEKGYLLKEINSWVKK